jgi:drug/metabolite transporter (DMT)-like permease
MRMKLMKTFSVVALAVLAQATGNVFLSKGMKQLALADPIGMGDPAVLLSRPMGTPAIWLGTGLMVLFFLLFAAALSWADLSFVLPVLSVEVIVNVAFAEYFLKESVSPFRWAGTLLIFFGVLLVLRSGKADSG